MTDLVVIDPSDLQVTPFFKFMEIENIPQSEAKGALVKELREVVEVRLAGNKGYQLVVPVDAIWRREGLRAITLQSDGLSSIARSATAARKRRLARRWTC